MLSVPILASYISSHLPPSLPPSHPVSQVMDEADEMSQAVLQDMEEKFNK